MLRDKAQAEPDYGLSGVRHEGGVTLNWAVVRNVGTGGLMIREKLKRQTRESESTEADHRDGIACSSEESQPTLARAKRLYRPALENGQPGMGGAVE